MPAKIVTPPVVVNPPPAHPAITLPPKTTLAEDMIDAGQRRINLIWEITQAAIAMAITLAVIYCTVKQIQSGVIENAFFLVISMYFIRTNHKLIGGVGPKPRPEDQQR